MADQPQETIEFILNHAFGLHSELVKSDANFTKVLRWIRERQNLVTSVIAERAIEALYSELHKHQAPETPRGAVLAAQSENLAHNRALFVAVDSKYPRLKNTPENVQLILDKLALLAGPMDQVKYDQELIDAAIHQLGDKLSMHPAPPPKAPPKKPAEQLAPGQLPLHATEQQMRAASIDQLRNLRDRRRAAGLE